MPTRLAKFKSDPKQKECIMIISAEHTRQDLYNKALFWLIRERPGGGWPPRNVAKVSGWLCVRLLAAEHNKTPNEVAQDLIERYRHHGDQ
jgi:hypothetical protein